MTHDIEDLLNLIKDLEERIIALEKNAVHGPAKMLDHKTAFTNDNWYWEHG